ncbi:MAG TPA: peptidoglycan-binding domain-containing protein [Terriglobales bacterium]|jgi:peptidoglycan hydrolase-like protein with peptidoglycan-binding domain|nr:peptidoglycan-binding domain-containing protein [Terriglobales bacterium]
MFLAGKAACAGIVFLLLAMGISEPRPTPITSGPDLRNGLPAVGHGSDAKKVQQSLRDKGHYQGDIDGVFGLRTRASIRGFQKAENLPATGQLDTGTADRLGVTPEDHKTGYQITQDKPSAGIQLVRGSRRANKTPRKAVNTVADPESRRGGPEKTLQAENENHHR